MALPSAWTESTLTTAVQAELAPVLVPLGLNTSGAVTAAVGTDVPALLNVTSVDAVVYGSIAIVVKVLRFAQWMAWQKAYDAALLSVDLRAGSSSITDSQAWEHLQERLRLAYDMVASYSEVIALTGGALPMPYAGGLSYSEKASRRENTDDVRPYFTRGLHLTSQRVPR